MKTKTIELSYDVDKFMLAVGRNLYSLRIGQSKDLEAVADAMKISVQRLDKIECGELDYELPLFFDLCAFYNVSPASVFPDNSEIQMK
jgi:transcriptional regulator with XRE-family HTH domain